MKESLILFLAPLSAINDAINRLPSRPHASVPPAQETLVLLHLRLNSTYSSVNVYDSDSLNYVGVDVDNIEFNNRIVSKEKL